MLMLSSVLVNEATPLHVRNAAGLALKNALSARVRAPLSPLSRCSPLLQDSARQTEYSTRWLALADEVKTKIKQDALMTLGSASAKAGTFASQVVAAIAAVELPENHWNDLIETLLSFVNGPQSSTNLKVATLQTIGFICEAIVSLFQLHEKNGGAEGCDLQKPEILSLKANEILTAVIHGARKEEPAAEVQLAAIHALFNSLEFVRENFEREVRLFPPLPHSRLPIWLLRASGITSCKSCARPRRTATTASRSAPLSASSES